MGVEIIQPSEFPAKEKVVLGILNHALNFPLGARLAHPAEVDGCAVICHEIGKEGIDIAEEGHLDGLIRMLIARGRPLHHVYRAASWSAARAFGLMDRGIIAIGMKADLNVIDFSALEVETPYIAFDLPAGGKRLLQRSRGYVATIVSGVPIYLNGESTGKLPGRLVRGAKPAPGMAS